MLTGREDEVPGSKFSVRRSEIKKIKLEQGGRPKKRGWDAGKPLNLIRHISSKLGNPLPLGSNVS